MATHEPIVDDTLKPAIVRDLDWALAEAYGTENLDEALKVIAEQARIMVGAHQAALSYIPDGDFRHAVHAIALSDKYAKYRGYDVMPTGVGTWTLIIEHKFSLCMSQEELIRHPRWKNFSDLKDARGLEHPPMRGWLVVPILTRRGNFVGLLQLSDKYAGEFTQQELALLTHLAKLVAPTLELQLANTELLQRTEALAAERRTALKLSQNAEVARAQAAQVEERLNLALKSSQVGTWSWNVVENSIIWDDYIHPLFGLKPGTFPGRFEDFMHLVHPADQERVGHEVTRAVEENAKYDSEFQVVWPDGSVHVLVARGKVYRDAAGQAMRMTGVCLDITARKQAQDKLKAEEQLLRRLLEIQENERRLVAHDIHDGFMQDVVGAYFHLQAVHGGLDSDTVESKVENVGSLLQKAIEEGRRLIRDIRPMGLDEGGVVEAIEHLIADEQKHAGLVVVFQHEVQFNRLESRLEGAIFRIVQEALTNVKHHAQTKHAAVQLTQRNDTLEVVVRDQGLGFDPSTVSPERFGLRGIRERARLFGGEARIESTPGGGTSIFVELPLQKEA